jgi:DNA polymerase-1
MDKLLLVDGHNMLFRVFFGMQRPMFHEDGRDMRCPVGFASSLNKLIKDFDASKMLVVFDSITSTRKRIEVFPDYKQNRVDYSQVPDDENPFTYLPDVYKTLELLDIGYLEADGYEADDYIATIAKDYHNDYDIVIVSTDSDFNQLVSDKIHVFKPRGKHSMMMTPETVQEKFSVTPEQVIEFKSLVGDTADNIPGIKGIGPKRAAEILSYGTIDEIKEGQTDIPEKYFNKVVEHFEALMRNKFLITMDETVPYKIDDDMLHASFDSFFKPKSVMNDL